MPAKKTKSKKVPTRAVRPAHRASEKSQAAPVTEDTKPLPNRVLTAAMELQTRRSARKSIVEFCQFTHPRYQPAWFHRFVAVILEKFIWGKYPGIHGVMCFEPPRHGKSEQITVRTPAWDLGEHPDEHYIATAYGDDLANTFSRACRNIIETPQYQRLWKHKLKTRNDTKWELVRKMDDQRATFIASGILSSMTGEGATRLIIDDPIKNHEEAYSKKIRDKIYDNYTTAATTRMAPNGKKMLVMTRWHEDDLAGRLLKKAKEDPIADQWIVIVLAATNDTGEDSYIWNTKTGDKEYFAKYEALWPEAYPRPELERIKANIGSVYWQALYMQRPTPATGGIFKRENWGWYDARPECDLLIQIYDTAFAEGQENDYSASITMGALTNGAMPILDAWRDKVGFPWLVAKLYERWDECFKKYQRRPDRVLVENKGSGISLIQQIETNNLSQLWIHPDGRTLKVPFIPITPMPANHAKIIRAQGISGYHESKGILLPRGAEWTGDFVDEHALFDKGPHDDWVDCTVHGVTYFVRPIQETEEQISFGEEIHISGTLDEYDLQQQLEGRIW